jgi:TonB family protein
MVPSKTGMKFQTAFLKEKQEKQAALGFISAGLRRKRENQLITPKRLAFFTSVALHLMMAMIAAIHIAQVAEIHDDVIIADILETKPPAPKRRMLPREVKPTAQPRTLQIQTPQFQQPVTTAVKIPTGDAKFALPAVEITIPVKSYLSGGEAISGDELENRLLNNGVVDAPPVISKIEPQQQARSIVDKIEETETHETDLSPEKIESPTAELSDVTQPPRFLHKVAPKYPDLARRAQKEGVVWLEASIGVDGVPANIRVLKGVGFGCDEAAIEALKASRFAPAKNGEKIVPVRIQIPYRFTLED